MKTWVAAIAILASTSAVAAERKFSIYGFDEVQVIGAVDVVIATGKGSSAKAEAQSLAALERVSLRNNGKRLIISLKSLSAGSGPRRREDPVKIYLSTDRITTVRQSGSGNLTIDQMSARALKIYQTGFGSVSVGSMTADSLTVAMDGAGQVDIIGKVADATIQTTGSGTLEASGLSAQRAKLTQRGPASVKLSVRDRIDIDNVGNGEIIIAGKPNCLVRSSGSAQILCNPGS
ncbi:MAG: DUF2807 domain-containing protein [Parasphingorhabdus sp.]|nr:DUF2807 domain-containing protein [Parasphingorhabdus sp.]